MGTCKGDIKTENDLPEHAFGKSMKLHVVERANKVRGEEFVVDIYRDSFAVFPPE
jgi:hypothetical protein